MSRLACDACDNLRENAADFVNAGVTSAICDSLHDNTGLNPNLSPLHQNEEDLHDANDCLIGTMDEQVEMYQACDWKEYMHKFVRNLYETLKAIICWLGGVQDRQNDICATVDALVDIGIEDVEDISGTLESVIHDEGTRPGGGASLRVKCARKTAYTCDGHERRLFLLGLDATSGLSANNLKVGDTMAKFTRSQLCPTYMSNKWFNQLGDTPYSSQIFCVDHRYFVGGILSRKHPNTDPDTLYLDCEVIATVASQATTISGDITVLHPQITTFRDLVD